MIVISNKNTMNRGKLMVQLCKQQVNENKDNLVVEKNEDQPLNVNFLTEHVVASTSSNGITCTNEPNVEGYSSSTSEVSCLQNNSSDEYCPESFEESSEEETHPKSKTKLTRWTKEDSSKWKKNKNIAKRASGQSYISKNGKLQSPKIPKPVDCTKCRWKCTLNFNEEYRKKICAEYWKMDYKRQKDFIVHNVKCNPPKVRRVITASGTKKEMSRTYTFENNVGKVRVCKTFFTKTLCISHGPIDTALSGVNDVGLFTIEDKRGRKEPGNKTDPELLKKVHLHIKSFPTVSSHYCRKSSQRQYLDPKLSIRKMHELYVDKCKELNESFVSEITYRRVFSENYNLSFFKPKKDQCIICENYKKKDSPNEEETAEYSAHIKCRDMANKAKADDKIQATKDSTFVSATFDLQSVLQLPSSEASLIYYTRKLCVYNLTVYESAAPNNAYCFSWSEINGQRGSCEIGTALLLWLQQLSESVTEVSLFSDTCSGQNRNQFIATLFLYAVQNIPHLQVIEHKFLEKGHSYMEVDSMHSAIESAKKFVSAYTMNDWLNIFHVARSKRKNKSRYMVKEVMHSEILDLKSLSKMVIKNRTTDTDGNRVNWLKIKVIRYEQSNPGAIFYKYNYEEPVYKTIKISTRGRPTAMPSSIPKLYMEPLPISEAKKKDLVKLCDSNVIPQEYHAWYKSLSVDKKQKDNAPEPGYDSDSEIEPFE